MAILINLVATRLKNGGDATLLRWYHDHVHLLMGCEALRQATLYRSIGPAAPQYLCLYEFPSHDDFLVFEGSAARALARHVVDTGWARDGIEITQRTQYGRLGQTIRAAPAASGATHHHIACLELGAGAPTGVARWLSDRAHAMMDLAGSASAAWHRAAGATHAGGDALVLLASERPDAGAAEAVAAALHGANPPDAIGTIGDTPASVATRWQGNYQRRACWTR